MSTSIKLGLSFLFCLAWAAAAQATSLTLDNCPGGCEGADLTLDVTNQGNGTFKVLYSFDTTGYEDSIATSLVQVGFKVIKDYTSATLVSAPNGTTNWSSPLEAPVTSNGSPCSVGGNGTDKVCIYAKNNLLDVTTDGVYTFEFLVVGGTEMDTSEWHFGGQWGDRLVSRGKIISDGAPAIPEPSAALLFGVGAVTVGRSLRRRR